MRDRVQFIVLRRNGKWSVKSADQERVFPGRMEALQAGIMLAQECGKNGKPSVVLFQRAKSRYDTVWTYGEDAYPPRLSGIVLAPETASA